ncbi:MAG: DsbA family protein [Acidobacteriota bacterium]
MQRLLRTTVPVLALGVLVGCFALGSAPAGADGEEDLEARKAKILANLILKYPQLQEVSPTMGALEASEYEGLDQGSFIVRGRPQQFLVSSDDTKLYLIQEPLDVSRSKEEIDAELAKRAAAEAEKSKERMAKLEASVAGRPFLGNPEAPVTIVEFSDFQCPYCARGAATVEQILEKYPQDVKVVFKHFPLGFHPWAKPAAIAANCAGNQKMDAFWTLHDKYFEKQKELKPDNVIDMSRTFLADSGLDMGAWDTCAADTESEQYKKEAASVDADMALGQSLGVSGTPGFFVNGTFLNGAQPIAAFEPLIAAAKK